MHASLQSLLLLVGHGRQGGLGRPNNVLEQTAAGTMQHVREGAVLGNGCLQPLIATAKALCGCTSGGGKAPKYILRQPLHSAV